MKEEKKIKLGLESHDSNMGWEYALSMLLQEAALILRMARHDLAEDREKARQLKKNKEKRR